RLLDRLQHPALEVLVGQLGPCDADHREGRRQLAVGGELGQRGHQLAAGEVPGGAEHHEHARRRPPLGGQAVGEWVVELAAAQWCAVRQVAHRTSCRSSTATRTTLRPWPTRLWWSPMAWAAISVLKSYGSVGMGTDGAGVRRPSWTATTSSGPPLCSWPVECRNRGP